MTRLEDLQPNAAVQGILPDQDASRIAGEVLTHLVGLVGASVRVTLEIEAEIPDGTSDNVVRTVTENSRTLRFTNNSGFEPD